MSYITSPQERLRDAGLSDAEIALGFEPGDGSDEEALDLARRSGLKWLEPDGEEGGYPGGFDMSDLKAVRKLVANARRDAAPRSAGHTDLEGLRDRLLHPAPAIRDENGYYCNPAWPVTDEDVHFGVLASAFGVDLQAVQAETQMEEGAYEAMLDAGHCRDWEPAPPEGDGWVLSSIHETEEGPVAWYVRRLASEARPGRPESKARFCPGCGSVGEVDAKYRDCCPDGGRARVIPEPLARHCHDLFQLALQSVRPVDLVAILKALRLRARKFPRYSFISPSSGGVQRMKDRAGRWVEFDAVAQLLDETCTDGLEKELHVVAASLTPAASAALAERLRQIEVEGWTAEHDDQHDPGELAAAAAAYALAAADQLHPLSQGDGNFTTNPPAAWPWAPELWKPGRDPSRMLEKALALGLAQMEQIARQKAAIPPTGVGAA